MSTSTEEATREAMDQFIRDADGYWPDARDAMIAAGWARVESLTEEHECEFGCASDLEHLQRAYDELKTEYAAFRRSMQGGN